MVVLPKVSMDPLQVLQKSAVFLVGVGEKIGRPASLKQLTTAGGVFYRPRRSPHGQTFSSAIPTRPEKIRLGTKPWGATVKPQRQSWRQWDGFGQDLLDILRYTSDVLVWCDLTCFHVFSPVDCCRNDFLLLAG